MKEFSGRYGPRNPCASCQGDFRLEHLGYCTVPGEETRRPPEHVLRVAGFNLTQGEL